MSIKPAFLIIVLALAFSSLAVAADDAGDGVVNVNTAGVEQLQLLPRIGPALAQRIIDFREAHGPFGAVDELVAVKGIGESSLDRLSPYVTTSGATTLNDKVKLPRSTASGTKAAG